MVQKDVTWLGDSLNQVKSFPDDVKKGIGYDVHRLQCGKNPISWKPVPGVTKKANKLLKEIRVKGDDGIYRAIYIASFREAIYILHAFHKKGNKIDKSNMSTIKTRYINLTKERNNV